MTFSWRAAVLFLITGAVLVLCAAVFAPFLPALTWAIALTVATDVPYRWLQRHIGRPSLTAFAGVLLVMLLIVVPAVLVESVARQIMPFVAAVQSGEAQDWITASVEKHPRAQQWLTTAIGSIDLREVAQSSARFIAQRLQRVVASSVAMVTQVVVMLFTLFFLFRDREQAVAALRGLLPLTEPDKDRLLERMRSTIAAVLQGRVVIAAVQGSLGGLMFWILGLPHAALWGLVMIAIAILPLLGTAMVWLPFAIILALAGHWIKALILVGWGAFVIGTVDNLLYPALVGSKMRLHTVPVFFSMLGGLALFGVSGIILGPLILTTAAALLEIWRPGTADRMQQLKFD